MMYARVRHMTTRQLLSSDVNVYFHWRLVVLVCVQSALRLATPSVLLDSHTWLVLELSHGGMCSPFDGRCRRYYGLLLCGGLRC